MLWFLLLPIQVLGLVPKLLQKDPLVSRRALCRLSLFPTELSPSQILWHCVSVGEVVCVTPLVKSLLADNPDLTITITTTTATGAKQVQTSFGDRVQHCYLPYDNYWFVKRLLDRIRPNCLLITEVEIWPSLINCAANRSISQAVVNARMTDRSSKGYAKLGRFFSETVGLIDTVSTQGANDKENYESLGADQASVVNNGNLKFELAKPNVADPILESVYAVSKTRKAIIIVAASTHAPEEQMIVEAHKSLLKKGHNVICLIVPRHPQRFNEVRQKLDNLQSKYVCYSDYEQNAFTDDVNMLLVDTMGVLNAAYANADIAFIGGSFAEKGGHNALEAALFKLPSVMGPSQFNNPEIYTKLMQCGNLVTVDSQQTLLLELESLLDSREKRQQAGQAGYQVIQDNRGAMANTKTIINELLKGF